MKSNEPGRLLVAVLAAAAAALLPVAAALAQRDSSEAARGAADDQLASFYFDPEQQFRQGGYAQLALRAQWLDPSRRFTVAVFGDSVTDKRYQTQVLFNTIGIGSVWSAPATYGVSLGVKF